MTTSYTSIVPWVQNLMLSARARGLGTTLTTALLAVHDDVRSIVGADRDVTFVACIPIGYPEGDSVARPLTPQMPWRGSTAASSHRRRSPTTSRAGQRSTLKPRSQPQE